MGMRQVELKVLRETENYEHQTNLLMSRALLENYANVI